MFATLKNSNNRIYVHHFPRRAQTFSLCCLRQVTCGVFRSPSGTWQGFEAPVLEVTDEKTETGRQVKRWIFMWGAYHDIWMVGIPNKKIVGGL